MEINEQSVAAYQEICSNPQKYNMAFRAIQNCFEKSDVCTAKHILAKQYMENEAKRLPKIFCYIIMDNVFGLCNGKDETGRAGYYLKFKPLIP